ncbi:MAG TPA: PH domain-containing protein [Syntrophomonadaceae bacterium]|nr:PH domain-containing protein [Syntrophomonadaceae bacterium]
MYFRLAPRDLTLRIMTVIAFIVLIPFPILYLHGWDVIDIIILLSIIVMYLFFYVTGPNGYSYNDEGIRIKRIAGDITIPKEDIIDVSIIEKARIDMNLDGNKGLFFYSGTFRERNGNKVKVHATRFTEMVRVRTTNLDYYLSPKEPQAFVDAIKEI